MHRYLALFWDSRDSGSETRAKSIESALRGPSTDWEVAYQNQGAIVAHEASPHRLTTLHRLCDQHGLVLGSLFHRKRNRNDVSLPVLDLNAAETAKLLCTHGLHLVEHYWGSYVAIVRNDDSRSYSILRDPTATLACYHAKWANIHIFFSDIEDLVRHVPMSLSINWPYIAGSLLIGPKLSPECGLREIEDIPGGEWISVSGQGDRRTTLWHPAQFCLKNYPEFEFQENAAAELRSVVIDVVHTLARQYPDVLVRLSGGLDSSIVTSCLSQLKHRPNVTCLNFYIGNGCATADSVPAVPGLSRETLTKVRRIVGSADERQYARKVAENCGFTLIERQKQISEWDFQRIWQAPLAPRPSLYTFVLDEDDAECEYASNLRAAACLTGEAGDTVFYNTLRAIGAVDYAYQHALGPHLYRHITCTRKLSGESITRVLGKTIKYGLLGARLPSVYDPRARPHLMTDFAIQAVPKNHGHHPWEDIAPSLCPGKINHIMGVAASVPYYHNVFHRERIAPSVHPLASQPVVETCLRIPTYVLLADGVPRGLARRAFEDLLPPEVTKRTVKGVSIGFWQRLLRHHIGFLRERLLDGRLVQQGLLDRRKLEGFLTDDQPFLSVLPQQIMTYIACEAWLSQWIPL